MPQRPHPLRGRQPCLRLPSLCPLPGPSVINAELDLFGLLSVLLHQDSNTAQQRLSHAGSQTISGCSSQEGSELHTC